MSLHILSLSPLQGSCLEECRRVAAAGDALLLISDGVYAALRDGASAAVLRELHAAGIGIFVLDEDCAARAVDTRLLDCVTPVDYGGFVALAVAHPRSVSWF